MQFFIDHKYKKIHRRIYAGDRCGFVETPIDKREFTNAEDYKKSLEIEGTYELCEFCQTVQIEID